MYHTPLDKLSIIAEYSSDAYVSERTTGDLTPRGQVNIGLVSYRAMDNATLGLAWLYGTTLNGSISFALDPTTDPYPQHYGDPPMLPPQMRSDAQRQQALGQLLQQRQGNSGALVFSASGLNALSDALFAETGNLTDVSVRGRTLVLSIGVGDVRAVCTSAAAMAARYNVDLEAVAASDAAGKTARCVVQRRGGGALVNASLTQDPGAALDAGLTLTPAALITIDASAPAEPSTPSAIQTIKADALKQQVGIIERFR